MKRQYKYIGLVSCVVCHWRHRETLERFDTFGEAVNGAVKKHNDYSETINACYAAKKPAIKFSFKKFEVREMDK